MNDAKEAIKQLREKRAVAIERSKANVKEHARKMKLIKDCIKGEGKTVPMIAEKTKIDPSEVLFYISTMKKYGEAVEGPKDGSFFTYQSA